jgi:hypothetical protein
MVRHDQLSLNAWVDAPGMSVSLSARFRCLGTLMLLMPTLPHPPLAAATCGHSCYQYGVGE